MLVTKYIIMKTLLKISLLILILASCTSNGKDLTEQYKKEILETEKAFTEMAGTHGISSAFLHFAAEDAVLNRGGLIKGKDSIMAWFESYPLPDALLTWEPEFVDVSKSGDLGYTYGSFVFTAKDSTGNDIESKGVFHTVWNRQPDGEWRYVWD